MARSPPEWLQISEQATPQVMRRIAGSVSNLPLEPQVRYAPMLAHWFLLDSMLLASRANCDGMHANALALTRQCVEAICIVELGVCRHPEVESILKTWDRDKITPGRLRSWLESNVWPQYGAGLWREPWSTFMREFTAAVQPYAHYGPSLAQWQYRLHGVPKWYRQSGQDGHGLIEITPRAYDPQKAARVTLYQAIQTFVLGRIWMAANPDEKEFAALINRLRAALGRSRYLDGHRTNWSQQFWAMVWDRSGDTVLE